MQPTLTNDSARAFALDQLDRGAVGVVAHHETDGRAVRELVRLHLAPDRATEITGARHRFVDVRDRDSETLEAGGDERRGRCTGRCGFLPLEQVDRAAIEAARADEHPRVPARSVESERGAGLRGVRRRAHRGIEAQRVRVEPA